jgi:hypothetical protein
MTVRAYDWLLFWAMLGGVACFTVLALSQRGDFETAWEMERAAHLLASVVFAWVVPKILLG